MQVLECAARRQLSCHVLPIALPDNYVEHGSVEVLRKETGIDAQSVTEKIMETYKELQIWKERLDVLLVSRGTGRVKRKSKSNHHGRKCLCRWPERRQGGNIFLRKPR